MTMSKAVAAGLFVLMCAAANHASAQGQAAEQFVVSGLLVLEGGDGLVWLQEPNLTQNRVITVRPGESVGPYRLSKILADRVELQGPGGTVFLPVYNGAPGPVVASASNEEPSRVVRQAITPASAPTTPPTAGAQPDYRTLMREQFRRGLQANKQFQPGSNTDVIKSGAPAPASSSRPEGVQQYFGGK